MRSIPSLLVAAAMAGSVGAQARDAARQGPERRVVAPGWSGRLVPEEEKRGARLTDIGFVPSVDGIRVSSGPAAIFWSATSRATGTYVVEATFTQARPTQRAEFYGLFLGGSQLDQGSPNYLFCTIGGNGLFTVKHQFGGEVNELAGRTAHVAIRRANTDGKTSNVVALRVTPLRTSCAVNGTEVWSYPSKDLVGPGRLASLDGVVGLRVGSNLDLDITGFLIRGS